jgi:hypothetical protein
MNFHDIPDFPAAAGSYHLSACHRTSSCIRDAARRHPPRGRPYNVAKMAHHSWVNPHIHLTLQSKSIMNQIGDPKKKSEKTTRDKRMARLGNFFSILPLVCSSISPETASDRVNALPGAARGTRGCRSAPPGRVSRQPSGSSEPLAGACPQTLTPLPRMRASGRPASKSRNAL